MTKKTPDWELIERDYRAGLLSIREIAGQHGVSHTAIQKRARSQSWDRDVNARAQKKADALVARHEVAKRVATETAATERQLIEATAQVIADVRMRHRGDIRRSMGLTNKLLDELEAQTDGLTLMQELGELVHSTDERSSERRHELYTRIIATPSRIDSVKKLSDTLKTLIGLEREAYGLEQQTAADALGTLLQRISTGSSSYLAPVAHDVDHD